MTVLDPVCGMTVEPEHALSAGHPRPTRADIWTFATRSSSSAAKHILARLRRDGPRHEAAS